MKKAARMIVQGTVQGVFFRQFVKEHADEFKLKGFVRNLTSGDIEIIVEGEGDAIGLFVEKVRSGPKHSQIRSVNVEERKWTGDFSEFKVLKF